MQSITLRLPNRFDFSHHQAFSEQTHSALHNPQAEDILLDFREVDYLDSAALGMIVYLHKQATQSRKQVKIINANGFADEILRVANIDKVLSMN